MRFKNGIQIRTRTTDVTVDYYPRTHAILVKIASQDGAGASPSIDILLYKEAARDFTWKAVPQQQWSQGERQGLRLTGHVQFFLRQQVTIEA